MRRTFGLFTVCAAFGWMTVGCNPEALRQEVPVGLNAGLSQFDVQAGVATRNTGTVSFNTSVGIGSGSLELSPNDISVMPADQSGGKGRINFQDGGSVLEVTVWVDAPEAVDTVCEGGDEYGPFEVELDENFVPQSVTPSTVELTENTLDLLNEGSFSLCIELVSPVDGTVTVRELTLNLGL